MSRNFDDITFIDFNCLNEREIRGMLEAAWEDYESAPEKGVIKFFPLGHRMNMWWCLFLLEKLLEERGMS